MGHLFGGMEVRSIGARLARVVQYPVVSNGVSYSTQARPGRGKTGVVKVVRADSARIANAELQAIAETNSNLAKLLE